MSAPILCPYDTTGITLCDRNTYWNGTVFCFGSYAQNTFAQWKAATGFDANSSIGQPTLDSGYVPTAQDTQTVGKGANLSTRFTHDK